jgi:hypothetical protein
VLEEAGDGYAVFYDPNESTFGLASSGVIVGSYPDLMSARKGM